MALPQRGKIWIPLVSVGGWDPPLGGIDEAAAVVDPREGEGGEVPPLGPEERRPLSWGGVYRIDRQEACGEGGSVRGPPPRDRENLKI